MIKINLKSKKEVCHIVVKSRNQRIDLTDLRQRVSYLERRVRNLEQKEK